MTLEAVAIRPSGHRMKNGTRDFRSDEKTLGEHDILVTSCLRWMESKTTLIYGSNTIEQKKRLESRRELYVPRGEFDIDTINTLTLDYRIVNHRRYMCLGEFMSILYQRLPEKIIVYEYDTPDLWYLGSTHQLFINKGATGCVTGMNSSGLVINYGWTHNQLGLDATCPIINFGISGDSGRHTYKRIFINMGRTKEWDNDVLATRGGFPLAEGGSQYDDPRLVLKRADATQLIDYLEELREIGEQSPAKIVQRYGQDPCATIKADIEKKLKLCGNWIREEGPRDR